MRPPLAFTYLALAGCGFTAGAAPGDGPPPIAVDGPTHEPDATTPPATIPYRKAITFDHHQVNGTLTNFPAWIDITDPDLAHARPDGTDLYFTDATGTAIGYEIQSWDPATHRVRAWVRVPSLDNNVATIIYLAYGNVTAAPGSSGARAFGTDYNAVWHLDDALPATQIVDATGARPGTPSLTHTTSVPGQLGAGLAFTHAGDQITFTNSLAGNQAHTISVWVSAAAGVSHTSSIVALGTAQNNEARWLHAHYNTGLAVGFYFNDWQPSANIDGAGWTKLDWVFEGSNGVNHIYRNGAEIAAARSR